MANLFFDGGGGYYDNTYATQVWQSVNGVVSFNTTGGAGGGPSIAISQPFASTPGSIRKSFPYNTTHNIFFGFHLNLVTYPNIGDKYIIVYLGDASGVIYQVLINSLGGIEVQDQSNTILANTNPGAFILGSTNKLEFNIVQDTAVGQVEIVVNGQSLVLTPASLNTMTRSGAWQIGYMQFGPGNVLGFGGYYSNMYMNDSSGATSNSYYGVCYVHTSFPSSNGTLQDFTTSTGIPANAYSLVANNPPNSSQYVFTSNAGDKVTFNFSSLPSGIQSVLSAKLVGYVNKTGAGARAITGIAYHSATQYNLTQKYLADNTQFVEYQFDLNPSDGTALTPSNVIANEYGIDVTV